MTNTANLIPVRTVTTEDRLEFHAADCRHRIPKGADVRIFDRTVSSLVETDAESVELNTTRPVMPCLRRLIGIAR